jgi:hypothetical protein
MAELQWSDGTTGQFINLRAFTEHREFWLDEARLPDWRTIRESSPQLIHPAGRPAKRLFITHRWDSADHPDSMGWQLRALRALGTHYNYNDATYCFWYDYMSLPQRRDTKSEQRIFRRGLENIRHIVSACDNICLISRAGETHAEDLAAMRLRGWIVFELYIRRSQMQRPLPLYEREAAIVDFGRMQYGWDDVVPDIGALAPLDTPGLLLAWLRNRGITCTNGSDLGRLAGFLHETLTKVEHFHEAPRVRFGDPTELTTDQLIALNIAIGTKRSMRFPELILERNDYDPKTQRWTVIFRRRPPLPQGGVDLPLSPADLEAMAVDRVHGTSPMYPGIRFSGGDRTSRVRLEVM